MTAFVIPRLSIPVKARRNLPPVRQPRRLPHRTPPRCSQVRPTLVNRLSVGIAGVALALTFSQTPLPSITLPEPSHAQTETVSEAEILDGAEIANLTSEQRKALREQSVRNTRAAGKTAQLFASARRDAENGDLDGALSSYNTIITTSPMFAPAYSNRANIYVAKRKFTEALKDYTRCLSLAPLDGDVWVIYVNRGATKLAKGDTAGALTDMNTANSLKGSNEIVLSNRAGVYEVLEKWDNAIRDYQAALRSNEVRPFWERYGLVLFQRNRPTEAVAILKRVANRFDVSDVHAALAVIYFEQGHLAEAETEWSRVDRPRLFESKGFLVTERKWPPRAVDAMDSFRHLKE